MIYEPNIEKKKLKEFLEEKFGISVREMIFNPQGEASWGYEILSEKKYFLKIYKSNNFSNQSFEFTNKLSIDCGVRNISYAIKSLGGEIVLKFEGFSIVLFNFIEGKTATELALNDEQIEEMGELLGRVHKSKEVVGEYPEKEDFGNPFKDQFEKVFERMESFSGENEYQREARELYLEYKDKFYKEKENLERLGELFKSKEIEFVNCHSEPSPDNIMVSKEGEIYLIDWDFPIFAPKEKDLLFFSDKSEPFLKGYRKVFSDVEINNEVLEFYNHLWNVQEISDWGSRLFIEESNEEELKHGLEELKEFLDYSGLKND